MALNEHTKALRDEYLRSEAELAEEAATVPGVFMMNMKMLLSGVDGATADDRENALIGFLAMNMASLYTWSKRNGFSDYKKFTALGVLGAVYKEVA